MQFEVQGESWAHLWTEGTRLAAVVVLLLVVILNMIFPMGEDKCKIKGN
tara:strand:- start:152 stop:298 length:147 start_codon:yes stop_codon:yes gene_type:complete